MTDDKWQVCPICSGTGMQLCDSQYTSIGYTACATCDGEKIINKETGLPPSGFKMTVK